MEVTLEKNEGLVRQISVSVPAEQMDKKINNKLKEVTKTAKIAGFRPGKVPAKVVQQRYGQQVRQEVLVEVLQDNYVKALQDQKLEPAGSPDIDVTQNENGKDLKFTASFEVYPEVSVADFSKLKIEQPISEVTDKDVDNMFKKLQKQHATWKETKAAAKKGDQVTIDFEGKLDGETFEGGTAKDAKVELGSNQMIPGFEEGIEGLKAGEEKTLELTFPEEYHNKDLAGKKTTFDIKISTVSKADLPKIDDEFAKRFGVEDGLDKFKEEVTNNMKRELKNAIKNNVKTAVMDGLVEANEIDLPQALIKQEIENVKKQALQNMGNPQQFKLSDLPDDMFKDQAIKRVKLGLIISEIVKRDKIEVSKEKIDEAINEIASLYQTPDEVITYYAQNQDKMMEVRAQTMEQQVVDHVLASAKVTEKKVNFDDIMNPQAN